MVKLAVNDALSHGTSKRKCQGLRLYLNVNGSCEYGSIVTRLHGSGFKLDEKTGWGFPTRCARSVTIFTAI